MLYRGKHPLPNQSQLTHRDLTAEDFIRRGWGGKSAYAFMLTNDEWQKRRDGQSPHLPYRYIIRSPDSSALAWTAFFTREAMQCWLDAYGFKLDREPAPGDTFMVLLPVEPAFQPLTDDGKPYDAGKPDPDHAAMYKH